MAGMLPGVECARRRRFHQSGGWSDLPSTSSGHASTRRSSFCLYTSNHESHLSSSSSSSMQRSTISQVFEDDKLEDVAREARDRLDERLRAQRKSETKRKNSLENLRVVEDTSMGLGVLQTEVFGLKKSGSKRFMMSWAKLGWKSSEQEECAICLEQFKAGETLAHLPCAHRFHSRCLVPWLHTNAHCPCCRMVILI